MCKSERVNIKQQFCLISEVRGWGRGDESELQSPSQAHIELGLAWVRCLLVCVTSVQSLSQPLTSC